MSKFAQVQALEVEYYSFGEEPPKFVEQYLSLLDCRNHGPPGDRHLWELSNAWECPQCLSVLCNHCTQQANALQKCGKCYGTMCAGCFVIPESSCDGYERLGLCKGCVSLLPRFIY